MLISTGNVSFYIFYTDSFFVFFYNNMVYWEKFSKFAITQKNVLDTLQVIVK